MAQQLEDEDLQGTDLDQDDDEQDDNDEQDVAAATPSAPAAEAKHGAKTADEMGLTSNPGTDREKLRALLMNNLQNRLSGGSGKQMLDMNRDMASQNRDNATMAAMGKAMSAMGTVGGRTPSSAPMEDMAKASAQSNAQEMGGYQQDDQRKQQLNEYLLGQMTRQDMAGQKNDFAKSKLDETMRHNGAMEDNGASRVAAMTKGMVRGRPQPSGGASSTPPALASSAPGPSDPAAASSSPSKPAGRPMDPQTGVEVGAYDNPKDNAQFTKLNHDMTAGLATRSDFASNQKTATAAGKLLTLGKQGESQDGGLDVRQIHEAAVSSAALVGGGTGGAQHTIDALVPPSTAGSMEARIEEFLTADPHGANQMAFVKRMMETAEREKHLAGENVNSIKAEVANGGNNLRAKYPARFAKEIVGFHFGSPGALDKDGHYIRKDYGAGQPPPAPPQGMGMANAAPGDAPTAPDAAIHPQAGLAKTWALAHAMSPDGPTAAKARQILQRVMPTGGQ